ncbi:MAG: 1-acyl-sn-glycerol-3-phosphate acyltransferase [Sciscionella sp.]|nr:1-acyl-sn-glycerol-3-phosphate acyltransferase [Sciscionella sp.]
MVALTSRPRRPTRRGEPPLDVYRLLRLIDRGLIGITGRLEVTGSIPPGLRNGPAVLVANHIGVLDPFVLLAAFGKVGISPRFLLTAGLLDAPAIGWFLRRAGHIRVDRGKSNVIEAFDRAVHAARGGPPLMVYPEGRISLDPGLWPERGKTGAARIALAADVPVIPISQWGAHEAVVWGTKTVESFADFQPLLTSWGKSVLRRPRLRVHFGEPIDLSDLSLTRPGDARRAHERIMRTIVDGLIPLRHNEMCAPRFHDPTRPTTGSSPWKPTGQIADR